MLSSPLASCSYTVAPEVYRSEPYNDRVDVFGFGIFMYEVMARSLLAFTHVGTRPAGISQLLADSNAYAERVAKGYRPPRVHAVPEAAWELITSAWHDDPCERPPMDHVVNVLKVRALHNTTNQLQRTNASCHLFLDKPAYACSWVHWYGCLAS